MLSILLNTIPTGKAAGVRADGCRDEGHGSKPGFSPAANDASAPSDQSNFGRGVETAPGLAAEAAALRPLVRGVVAKVLGASGSTADIDDGTNECLRRAIEGFPRLRPGELLRPWVVGIAKHVALDILRSKKRVREREAHRSPNSSEEFLEPLDRVADTAPDPYESYENAERDEAIHQALERLPEGTQKALALFHLEGLGYQEIATRLDVPLGTVATWVMRGRKSMALAMAKKTRDP